MIDGLTNGDSNALTVNSAASAIEGILSREETPTPPKQKTPPTAAAPEPTVEDEVEEQPEPLETDEQDVDPDLEEEESEVEPDVEPPKTRKIKVAGEEVEVTEEELEKGYSRNADYTRKTQQLAEKAKAFEADQAAVRAERAQYATSLTQLDQALAEAAGAEPDWDTLREENPAVFAETWAAWAQHKERVSKVQAERANAIAKVQADQNEARKNHLDIEYGRLVEAIPSWKDTAVADKERGEMFSFAVSLGFTEDALKTVDDHKVLVLLRKAMLYDNAQKVKPTVRANIEKVVAATPGPSAATKPAVTEQTRRKQRLAKTGSIKDAAAAMESLLD